MDDDPWIGRLVTQVLGTLGHRVRTALTGEAALAALAEGFTGILLLDEHLPDSRGSELFRTIRERGYTCPVVFLTAFGTTALELRAIQDGAVDLVDKTELAARLPDAVCRAAEHLESGKEPDLHAFGMIAASAPMRAVLRQLASALSSRVSVLIRGESGTGKELLARALHEQGPRRSAAFVAVNCAGFPPDLLESELFGYERGAFTGANQRKLGRFDQAQGGTLFLDEIGDMPAPLQAKLLRVVQESEYQRLGGTETIRADVRIVSATHRDLEADSEAGRFRADLYFRLSQFTVTSPPLRERRDDIPPLARHFAQLAARREGRPVPGIAPRTMEALRAYDFPGNVRELENTIGYAVIAGRGPSIGIADLPLTFVRALAAGRTESAAPADDTPRRESAESLLPGVDAGDDFPSLAAVERRHVAAAMTRAKGNKVEAARLLGVSRMTLYRKLEDG